jgi:hypothetical protein
MMANQSSHQPTQSTKATLSPLGQLIKLAAISSFVARADHITLSVFFKSQPSHSLFSVVPAVKITG